MDSLSPAAEEALEWAVKAAEAIEEAGRNFGPNSEEVRLAKAAYARWTEEYQELSEDDRESPFWKQHCKDCPGCAGCLKYDA
jgi:hypothetical protein